MAHTRQSDPRAPTAAQVSAARIAACLSERAAAELIYRTAAAWTDYETGARRMDRALWHLFALRIGRPDLLGPAAPGTRDA